MATSAPLDKKSDPTPLWHGFRSGLWQKEINVRDFIQQNYTPYDGDESFLAPATERTKGIWKKLEELFVEERRKQVLDVSQIPSSITAHPPGYIDRNNEVIVGLQTDAPLKRAIMPNGGFRLVANALKTYGYEPDPTVVETFTKYRKTHNDAVFDAYTAEVRRCRSSHILTGLPDAYGRGRIIGDYRRVALYGILRLIERKQEEKRELDSAPSTDAIIRDREELAEQLRALQELQQMATSYGFDISGPAGGEPLMQDRFVVKLLAAARGMGIHTTIETNGYYGERLTDAELGAIDLVMYGIKTWDPERHHKLTGREIGPALEFARRLSALRKPAWIRFVLVPGLTDDAEDIARIAEFAAGLGNIERVEVLPFHQMGRFKWKELGIGYALDDAEPPAPEAMERACAIFRAKGLNAD